MFTGENVGEVSKKVEILDNRYFGYDIYIYTLGMRYFGYEI